ncbi:MAG TPA: fibronectin type III domain-containing protein, partial [Terriglobales bacterium]|nr:fibronectin type III domain-containing protein [Terriglobales bacterium]
RLLVCLVMVVLAACGTPGAPQPPSLRLPKPVEDLKAVRQGDKVLITWTAPRETTDRQGIRGSATARICRSYRTQTESDCKDKVGDVPSVAGQKATYTDDLSGPLRNPALDFVNYNVEVLNDLGRSAGPSNAVTIFLAPSMPAAQKASATLERDGILIEWTGAEPPPAGRLRTNHAYRVIRSGVLPGEGTVAETVVGDASAKPGPASIRDRNFIWERGYSYRVVGMTQVLSRDGRVLAEFEGTASAPAEINAHDVFPPGHPNGLQAVYSGLDTQRSIDLTWTPSEETDLAGYNVYRREGQGEPARINKELVKTPSYRDAEVQPGKTYSYAVTAVDARGNEGKSSEPATEKVPE